MKLLSVLILAGSMVVSASVYSQKTKINLQLENSSLTEILNSIEKNSEFIFIYNEKVIKSDFKKSISVKDESIEKVLSLLLEDADVSYRIDDRQIFLYKKDETKNPKSETEESTVDQVPKKEISGTVFDSMGQPLPGVTIVLKGTTIGVVTDSGGGFRFSIPVDTKSLLFSFVGMKSQEIVVGGKSSFNVVMLEDVIGLEEVVAVGYGIQKKASVVGAITTTTYKELQRTGGVTNVAQALTGNLPGVTTIQTIGQPGNDDPKIYIRGQSTWNGGGPYILVDGVERRMNDLDMSEIDNVSVLKDASATAVYGVKGANGVILITTKRGSKGKTTLTVSANSTLKIRTKMIDKLDSYNTLRVKNEAIEREVVINEVGWIDYTPLAIVERYRNQQNLKYPEAYPNVDWQEETLKKSAMSHRVNMNIAGGTDFAKYFSSLAYMHEGDLLKSLDNGKGYKPGMGYDKFNFRTNLDLNITKSTQLKFNLAGIYGITKDTYGVNGDGEIFSASQLLPPNIFLPRYSDGRWGRYPDTNAKLLNSAARIANSGIRRTRKTDLTTDISLTQNLDFITKGLSVSGNLSFDNHFESLGGIYEPWLIDKVPTKWINPTIEDAGPNEDINSYITINPVLGNRNQYAWVNDPWVIADENADGSVSSLSRRLFYQVQANYARTFGKHDFTTTGVINREERATGSEFKRFREDWVFRATYNYSNRYFAEFNGAYNGSEKFGPGYRFAFFPSAAMGWTISNENFMKSITWVDKLKLRYSYGFIGDDGITSRWLYDSQWGYGSNTVLSENVTGISPYPWYRESVVGNPGIHWEKATKTNFGFEMAVLKNMFSTNIEYFTEDRTDILLGGGSRILPVYYGATPPTANVGRVTKKGYEIELQFNKNLNQDLHLWANASMAHTVDKIISKEEPQLKDSYLLAAGFQIDQTKSMVMDRIYTNWNEVYASTPLVASDQAKLPGSYNLVDFNADGVINEASDAAPYGYSIRPQNSFNLTLGADYKGFSWMIQFYGVNNVTRYLQYENFGGIDIAYAPVLDFWSKENPDGASFLPRWKTAPPPLGNIYQLDGSYLRLKNVELSYTFSGDRLKGRGISSLKFYLNGNNLAFWSKLPNDFEQWAGGNVAGDRYGVYPTSSRINLGFDIKF